MLSPKTIRVAAVGDVHCTRTSHGRLAPLFEELRGKADVLLLCGDLCDYGLPEEAEILVQELAPLRDMPILCVFGNHDYESDKIDEVRRILTAGGLIVLDGEGREILGVGFAGVKGFGGGFGRRALEPWGESAIKAFVQEAVQESLRLETALAKLHTGTRVVLMHYAPIEATVKGEPLEIYPFLGSSRLEEPLTRFKVDMVFHGHAHYGTLEGKTDAGIPVYNVSLPILQRAKSKGPVVRIWEVPVKAETAKSRGIEAVR